MSNPIPKLRDGTEFSIGMTVVFETGRELKTDHHFEIIFLEYQGRTFPSLQQKGGSMSMGLNLLYPSQQARIADQVQRLKLLKLAVDGEIAFLQSGGDPKDSLYLQHSPG